MLKRRIHYDSLSLQVCTQISMGPISASSGFLNDISQHFMLAKAAVNHLKSLVPRSIINESTNMVYRKTSDGICQLMNMVRIIFASVQKGFLHVGKAFSFVVKVCHKYVIRNGSVFNSCDGALKILTSCARTSPEGISFRKNQASMMMQSSGK